MHKALILNGFAVDPRLASLMLRSDWPGKRTSEVWMKRFPSHPSAIEGGIPFVDFCGPEHAVRENQGLLRNYADPALSHMWGRPSLEFPPGDFDPTAGYLIGFTDYVDACICVDLRLQAPAIIYDNLNHGPNSLFATAFNSIDDFVQFYVEQHGA